MSDNVSLIGTGDKDEFIAAVESMKRTAETQKEYYKVLAESRKSSYDSHVANGFTPEQALELCKTL